MHLCLDADLILLQYEILEGHTQLTHLHFMLPPFCRKSLYLWGSAHINSNLDGASRWVRAFANQKGEKPILQSRWKQSSRGERLKNRSDLVLFSAASSSAIQERDLLLLTGP